MPKARRNRAPFRPAHPLPAIRLAHDGLLPLGYPLSILNHKSFRRKVHEDNANLTAIVGVDGTRRVEHRNSFLDGQTATGTGVCASNPAGKAIYRPVGTKQRCNGSSTIGSERLARISIPADSSVAYAGNGCFDLFIIWTVMALITD